MKSIRDNTLFDLINRKTKPTISTDKDIAFIKPIYSTVDEKEDLGIQDQNLILSGDEFPSSARDGQIFVKNGKTYIYKENK
jgi:hypothetical protein